MAEKLFSRKSFLENEFFCEKNFSITEELRRNGLKVSPATWTDNSSCLAIFLAGDTSCRLLLLLALPRIFV